MPQKASSEEARRLRHMSFELRLNGKSNRIYTFLLNPEEMSQEEQARAVVTQTISSAYIEKYGLSLPNFSISGTTGFHARQVPGGGQTDGYERFHDLRNNIYRLFFSDGALGDDHWQLFFYQWEDSEFWEVFPLDFTLRRSKSAPILYQYDIKMVGLRKLDSPAGNGALLNHTREVDALSSLLSNPIRQAQRIYDALNTVQTHLTIDLGARNETIDSWRSTYVALDSDYVSSATEWELFNETNYPGSNALLSQLSTVKNDIGIYLTNLRSYLSGQTTSIPMLVSKLEESRDYCRTTLEALENLSNRPYTVINTIQQAMNDLGLMTAYPSQFNPAV